MLEPIDNQYIQIGFISGSYGIDGQVVIESQYSVPALFDKIELIYLQDNRRDLFPARIMSIKSNEKNNRLLFFVKLLNVRNREQSESLKGYPVFVEREPVETLTTTTSDSPDFHLFELYNEQEEWVGRIEEILENPAHPILKVKLSSDDQLLVPFVDEYIGSVDEESKIIYGRNLHQLKYE